MKKKPLISIVLPTYNRKKFLKRSINSVLKQTYKNWELIIVDDGSTDGTKEFVGKHFGKNKKIRYFVNKRHNGAGGARNTGMLNSKGEFISFLDSDDAWIPSKLQKEIDYFKKNLSIDVLGGDSLIIEKDSKKLFSSNFKNISFSKKFLIRNIIEKINFPTQTTSIMFRRNVFYTVGLFDESLMRCQDLDYWMRVTDKFLWGYISEPLVEVYRDEPDRNNTYSSDREVTYILFQINFLKNLHKKINLPKLYKKLINKKVKQIIVKNYFNLGYHYRKTNKIRAFYYYFRAMMHKYDPEHLTAIKKLFIRGYYNKQSY